MPRETVESPRYERDPSRYGQGRDETHDRRPDQEHSPRPRIGSHRGNECAEKHDGSDCARPEQHDGSSRHDHHIPMWVATGVTAA